MKNPTLSIKKAIYNTLGDSFTVSSNTVYYYTDPPQSPPSYYSWCEDSTFLDVGTKQGFTSEVQIIIHCIAKQSGANYSTLLLDQIVNSITTQLISRGQTLITSDSDFEIYSVVLQDITQYEKLIGNKTETAKALRLLFKVDEK